MDEWTGFEVSSCWVKEDWSERRGTMADQPRVQHDVAAKNLALDWSNAA